jgi:hypothetical protein
MERKLMFYYLLLLLVFCSVYPASATQYNPPWAHNYGFLYGVDDSRPEATYAASKQSIIGYNAYDLPNSGAYIGFNNMKDDAIFFVAGHGSDQGGGNAGGVVKFNNGTESWIIAQNLGYTPGYNHYFLSSYTNELKDVLLAVYVACYSGRTSPYYGNLIDMSQQKGIDNSIGFK